MEASLAFPNGLVIPLLSEFLEYAKGDTTADKQDCELRAFTRLSARIKALFPRLPILLLLDGLYANGPVMHRCRQFHWQFMIVLKDQDLSTVWEEFHALHAVQPTGCQRHWGERRQRFSGVNGIDYAFSNHGRHHLHVHVVVCEETWETIDAQGARLTTTARHAWLSSAPLSQDNVHERCNLGARHRWGIEAGFLVEKHQGYQYEHAFAYDWNAMKGYHCLMRLAHLFNTLARFARHLRDLYRQLGVRGAIAFIRTSCAAPGSTPRGCAACWPSRYSFSSNKRRRARRRTRPHRRPPVPGTVGLATVTPARGRVRPPFRYPPGRPVASLVRSNPCRNGQRQRPSAPTMPDVSWR